MQVEIAGQRSNASSIDTSFGYKIPAISTVEVTGIDSVMKTNGDSSVSIGGSHFGPACIGHTTVYKYIYIYIHIENIDIYIYIYISPENH